MNSSVRVHTPRRTTVLSQRISQRNGVIQVHGLGQCHGSAMVDVRSRAEKSGPAFDVSLRITDVDMSTMSDLFRAYGNFDVASGQFVFYSELAIAHGAITGYVKPMFKDIGVYAPQTEDKSIMHKLYVKVVGVMAKVLKNLPGSRGRPRRPSA